MKNVAGAGSCSCSHFLSLIFNTQGRQEVPLFEDALRCRVHRPNSRL